MSEQGRPIGQRVKHGFESKILVPLAVTVVSAATSYLIKKLPMLLEEKVLPKLREQGGAAGVRETVVEAAEAVTQKAAKTVPSLGEEEAAGAAGSNGEQPADEGEHPADDREEPGEDREEERRKREERREERKRALQRA